MQPGPAPTLDQALADTLAGTPEAPLRAATTRLIEAYRSGAPPAGRVLATPVDALAYAAYRMPATHAAATRALALTRAQAPDWAPTSLLDAGGGTGAVAWAATEAFPSLRTVTIADAAPDALALGRRLAARHPVLSRADWRTLDLAGTPLPPADLTTLGYVLGELPDAARHRLVESLATSAQAVLVLEPGTPRGYRAILDARERLLAAGWHLLAPCPHEAPCPLRPGDWCHTAVRLPRSALHRRVKGADRSFEDEPVSWLAATRAPVGARARARVVRRPVQRKGLVQLELCRESGTAASEVVSRRRGEIYRAARDVEWGDPWPETAP